MWPQGTICVAYLWRRRHREQFSSVPVWGQTYFRRLKHKHAHFTLFMLRFMAYDGRTDGRAEGAD